MLGVAAPDQRPQLGALQVDTERRGRVEGETAFVLSEDVHDASTARPSTAVRLLPGRDPWVMATGTDDRHVVPPARRAAVSRSANLVLFRGVVAGTWAVRQARLDIIWAPDAGRAPRKALADEASRLSSFIGRTLELSVAIA